ncbi:helix-turn-helix transcriptional regulator [Erysipelothrix rhusiopathiae]|uniref:helix-turn-helix transcriptional regulator n=1 Tax=Erysipelothrix rhusiopathiae TaxID=1648 RepID=UPI003F484553
MSNILGQRLKARRKELRISQQELAVAVGYTSRSTIAKIEAGVIDLSQSKIYDIAEALETTPTYLLGLEEELEALTATAIVEHLQSVTVDQLVECFSQLDLYSYEKVNEAVGKVAQGYK